MDILSRDEEEFNKIIEKKIQLEVTQDKDGRNFEKILGGYKYNYTGKQINHFERIAEEIKEKLK